MQSSGWKIPDSPVVIIYIHSKRERKRGKLEQAKDK
jgi:hypothetical protein